MDDLERGGWGARKKRPKDALHEKIDSRVFPKTSIICSCMVWATDGTIIDPVCGLWTHRICKHDTNSGHGYRPYLGNRRLIHKGIIENPASSFSPVITLEASFLDSILDTIDPSYFARWGKWKWNKKQSACSALQLTKGTTASIFKDTIFEDNIFKDTLHKLHANYVLVPADKAANNVIVVCKKYYILTP